MTLAPIISAAVLLTLLQAPATGSAVLQGRVVRAGSGARVERAQIVAAKVGGALADYRTDGSGHHEEREGHEGPTERFGVDERRRSGWAGRRSSP